MQKLLQSVAFAFALLGAAQAATAVTNIPTKLRRTPDGAVIRVIPRDTLLTVACHGLSCRTSYRGRGGYISAGLVRLLTRSVPVGKQPWAGAKSKFYVSCSQMRRAGAAPIRVGKPGYRAALDADHDGWACRYDKQR